MTSPPGVTVEEARLGEPTIVALLAQSPLRTLAETWCAQLQHARSSHEASERVERAGRALWQSACALSTHTSSDDRPLYWTRLSLTRHLRATYAPPFALSHAERASLIERLEHASRGLDALVFPEPHADRRVLLCGFDPFSLQHAVDRSNPSGAAVLALHGVSLHAEGAAAQVRGSIFPVRFRDFDEGLVEATLRPLLTAPAGVDLIMTLSQNNVEGFTLERWAGRRRTCTRVDNLELYGSLEGPVGAEVCIPRGAAGELEFERSSLPIAALLGTTLRGEDVLRENVDRTPEDDGPAVRGSGGNYLSNEIFYRVAALERSTRGERARIPVGHLHVPLLSPPSLFASAAAYEARRQQTVDNVRRLVLAALPRL